MFIEACVWYQRDDEVLYYSAFLLSELRRAHIRPVYKIDHHDGIQIWSNAKSRSYVIDLTTSALRTTRKSFLVPAYHSASVYLTGIKISLSL